MKKKIAEKTARHVKAAKQGTKVFTEAFIDMRIAKYMETFVKGITLNAAANPRTSEFLSLGNDNYSDETTYADEGGVKYYVMYAPTKMYTAIGAKNAPHAFNKATKLWQGLWTSLQKNEPDKKYWEYVSVIDYGAIVREHKEVLRDL